MADSITTLGLCAGVGWLDEAVRAGCEYFGWGHRVVGYVERDAYAASVLLARMEESSLEPAPVWCGDLAGFDGRPFRGCLDALVAGLPCQPYSNAGKRQGWSDHRSYGDGDGPIPHALRIIDESDPALVFFENVPAWVTGGWFRPVGEELCRMGFTLEDPLFVTAEAVGAAHRRERVFILAYRPGARGRLLSEPDGRLDSAHNNWGGGELDDAGGDGPGEPREPSTERPVESQRRRIESGRRRAALANTISADIQQATASGAGFAGGIAVASAGTAVGKAASESAQGWRREHADQWLSGPASGSLFAPGPGLGLAGVVDDILELFDGDPDAAWRRFEAERRNTERWIGILDSAPHLCPKIEPGLHCVLDGHSVVLDASRADQLRCSGNGVVALQGSVAFIELMRRAMK